MKREKGKKRKRGRKIGGNGYRWEKASTYFDRFLRMVLIKFPPSYKKWGQLYFKYLHFYGAIQNFNEGSCIESFSTFFVLLFHLSMVGT